MLTDGWKTAGLSNSVLSGTAARVVINGDDIAIWRGQDGIVRAWENRCPHRGMRLSYGMVRGNTLTCLYHGWSYNGEGGCAAIPAHPDLEPPKTIKTVKYNCRELAGMIWVSAKEDIGDDSLPQGIWSPCRSLHLTGGDETSLGRLSGSATQPRTNWTVVHPDGLDCELLLAVQPMGAMGIMLHGAVAGDADPTQLVAASRWMIARRAEIEPALAA